jgi:Tat protein secretion system quality control protein TatD with DNase activity
MKYFDVHCHVQLGEYDADREDIIARMQEAEVGGLIVGVDLESSQRAVDLVRHYGQRGLYDQSASKEPSRAVTLVAAVGLHPNDIHIDSIQTGSSSNRRVWSRLLSRRF